MNEKTKSFILYGMSMTAFVLAAMFTIKQASATSAYNADVQDHFKTVIKRTPYNVEVCSERKVSGDKTGDTLLGAIIGGAIGQNITKDLPDGATAGAIIGGILGNQNSTSSRNVCKTETRYNEEQRTIYSHSTITFVYEGKQYKLNFKK